MIIMVLSIQEIQCTDYTITTTVITMIHWLQLLELLINPPFNVRSPDLAILWPACHPNKGGVFPHRLNKGSCYGARSRIRPGRRSSGRRYPNKGGGCGFINSSSDATIIPSSEDGLKVPRQLHETTGLLNLHALVLVVFRETKRESLQRCATSSSGQWGQVRYAMYSCCRRNIVLWVRYTHPSRRLFWNSTSLVLLDQLDQVDKGTLSSSCA